MSTTILSLQQLKQKGEKIACLTVYDASLARIVDEAGMDVLLVGDTLGEVIQGHEHTIPVSMEDVCYHTSCVTRVARNGIVIADLPFMTYATPQQALQNSARLAQAGAQMIKIEGGVWLAETIQMLTERGIAVCGHLGLTPQSVHKLGGYRQQAKTENEAEVLLNAAKALEQAGADLLVLECVPSALAKRVTQSLSIPTIGIGAGPDTDGQILVIYDILEISSRTPPSFVKDFLSQCTEKSIAARIKEYVRLVKDRSYPSVR